MIRAVFEIREYNVNRNELRKESFELDLPEAPREGDYVTIDETGDTWRIESVIWVIDKRPMKTSLIIRLSL